MNTKYRFGKSFLRDENYGYEREWLLANGLGGFSNGSIGGTNARIHSGYLVASLNPPVDRTNILLNVFETIRVQDEEYCLKSQMYTGKKKNRDGYKYIEAFEFNIIPTYIYQVNDIRIKKSVAMWHGHNTVAVRYEIINGSDILRMTVTPEFSLRENNSPVESAADMKRECIIEDERAVITDPEDDRYKVYFSVSSGRLKPRGKSKQYDEKRFPAIDARNGFEGCDTAFSPFDVELRSAPFKKQTVYFVCSLEEDTPSAEEIFSSYIERGKDIASAMEDDFLADLAVSADTFIVDRNSTGLKTILAGFPWFTDWGRDTMIALQGLTMCTGRLEDTASIIKSFAMYLKDGLIPNMFPSSSKEEPIYNTADASMWYFYSVYKYLEYSAKVSRFEFEKADAFIKNEIYPCLEKIIQAYKNGTNFSICMQEDGLIHAGSDFDQVTWMDVRVGEWVVTPRHGKPVEINALWYNALKIMQELGERYGYDVSGYKELSDKVYVSFNEHFWNKEKECLIDVADPDDDKVRPNQIWAVSLPFSVLDREKERKVVDCVYRFLYTAYGLRSLSYTDPEYIPEYIGPLPKRDAAYHMGTSWAFPLGGFISAFMKVNDHSKVAASRAMEMLETVRDHMNDGCINGIAEVFDGTDTCTGNGCYNQAWSVGEILRAYYEDVKDYL